MNSSPHNAHTVLLDQVGTDEETDIKEVGKLGPTIKFPQMVNGSVGVEAKSVQIQSSHLQFLQPLKTML